MEKFLKRTWAEIDLDALAHNMKQIRGVIGDKPKIMATIKADGYGCGDMVIAKELLDFGVDCFAVASLSEAIPIRKGIKDIPILILGYTSPEYLDEILEYNLTQTIVSYEYAIQLNTAAQALGRKVNVHIKLNTGMNRIGIDCVNHYEKAFSQLLEIYNLKYLNAIGIFTHFSSAYSLDVESEEYTQNQFKLFIKTIDELTRKGINVGLRHCCNSAATINHPEFALDMVRPGTVMYGIIPQRAFNKPMAFKPVLALKSTIAVIQHFKKGAAIGYARSKYLEEDIDVAVINAGYADGYPKRLSNIGQLIVADKFAPVIGNVCMDQLMIDVTGIKDIKAGDEVTLIGKSGTKLVAVSDILDNAGVGLSEVLCGITKRATRLYIKDNKKQYYTQTIQMMYNI